MEDVMKCPMRRELEAVNNRRDLLEHFEGTVSFLLRPSTRCSQCRISVSRAFGESKGTQRSSLLSCLTRAEPRRQAWLWGFRGSQAIGLRIRGFTSEGIGREGLQTQ